MGLDNILCKENSKNDYCYNFQNNVTRIPDVLDTYKIIIEIQHEKKSFSCSTLMIWKGLRR